MYKRYLAAAVLLAGSLLPASASMANADDLAASAAELISSFSTAQKELIEYPLKSAARATWSNLPTVMAPPAGVMLGDLTDEQRLLVHDMLSHTLSSQGYLKTVGIMWLDDVLRQQEQALLETLEGRDRKLRAAVLESRSSGRYALAMFGDPQDDAWGYKLTGHHLAVNVTVQGDQIGIYPGFFGSNPRTIQEGPYSGYTILGAEKRLGLELLSSLSAEQRGKAVISGEKPEDVLEGPGRRGSLQAYEGLPGKSLNAKQLQLLQRLVGEYVRNARAMDAAAQLDRIADAGWDSVWFSWRGPTDEEAAFYYRVHGPRILIEYNLTNPNHDHAVVRDPMNDYGEDWLGLHYEESHPSREEAMAAVRRAAGIEDSDE